MKIVKLISNKAAKTIKEKHTNEEIQKGIASLAKIEDKTKWKKALLEKLTEEVGEVMCASDNLNDELDDVIEVCRSIKGEGDKFSERWAMVVGRGHYKNEED